VLEPGVVQIDVLVMVAFILGEDEGPGGRVQPLQPGPEDRPRVPFPDPGEESPRPGADPLRPGGGGYLNLPLSHRRPVP
jgi:hypothetical protein